MVTHFTLTARRVDLSLVVNLMVQVERLVLRIILATTVDKTPHSLALKLQCLPLKSGSEGENEI